MNEKSNYEKKKPTTLLSSHRLKVTRSIVQLALSRRVENFHEKIRSHDFPRLRTCVDANPVDRCHSQPADGCLCAHWRPRVYTQCRSGAKIHRCHTLTCVVVALAIYPRIFPSLEASANPHWYFNTRWYCVWVCFCQLFETVGIDPILEPKHREAANVEGNYFWENSNPSSTAQFRVEKSGRENESEIRRNCVLVPVGR